MKRTTSIVLTTLAVIGTTAAMVSPVSADAGTTTPTTAAYGHGGMRGPGVDHPETDPMLGDEILHDYTVAGYSAALGLSVAELETRLAAGETLADIAVSTGLTLDQFQDLRAATTSEVLAQAVADGVITAEQADWMQYHGADFSDRTTGSMQGTQSAPHGAGRGNRP
jgi:hypothetical protein